MIPLLPRKQLPKTKSRYSKTQEKEEETNKDPVSREGIKRMLLKTREKHPIGSMDTYSGPVGTSARSEFFDSYKQLNKLSQRNRYEKLEDSPNVAYLEEIKKQKLQPKPFGIIKRNGPEESIDLHLYSIGDSYASAFSYGLKHCRDLKSINLKSNRLTERGSKTILQNLEGQSIKSIILAENKIGTKSTEYVISMLENPKSSLKYLNLENTGIGDNSVIKLIDVLSENTTLKKLNLARNNLSDKCSRSLKELLKFNSTLRKLDLHWNTIRGWGAINFFEGLYENDNLQELDISWNAIGKNNDLEVAQTISKALKSHKNLQHLDMSFNYLVKSECLAVAEGLKENKTLLGIHMLGNECTVDSKGFVIEVCGAPRVEQGHFFRRIIEKPNYKCKSEIVNCWVCENWVEMNFKWTPGTSGDAKSHPIFLHLECDNWEPELMQETPEGTFELTRAVPPGRIKFFFSQETSPMKSKEFKVQKLTVPLSRQVHYWEGCRAEVKMKSVNVAKSTGIRCDMESPFSTKPRTPSLVYNPPELELERIPWSIPVSLFKDYKFDDDKHLNNCFEFDWNYSRLTNLIKNEEDQNNVKELLRSHYKYFRETYRNIAALSGLEYIAIGGNDLKDFLANCNLFDSYYAISDLGVNWNSCIVPKEKGQVYNSGSALCRYEFMEILVRICSDRYVRNKLYSTVAEGLQIMLQEHLIPFMQNYNSNKWRMEKYLCENVDLVLKCHKQILDSVYKKYSGKKAMPGQKPFMSLDEFKSLCNDAKIINDQFTSREVDLSFHLSMMTRVDELYSKKHIEMSFVEFVEAISRACDYANLPAEIISEEEEGPPVANENLPLWKKIENAMPRLLKICPAYIQDSFVFPTAQTYHKMMYRSPVNS